MEGRDGGGMDNAWPSSPDTVGEILVEDFGANAMIW